MLNSDSNVGSYSYYTQLLEESVSIVSKGLQDLTRGFNPVMAKALSHSLTHINADSLGLRALATVVVLSTYQLDVIHKDQRARDLFDHLMKLMTSLYVLENITDDFCVIEISEGEVRYEYADLMSGFYLLLEAFIEGRTSRDETLANVKHLPSVEIKVPSIQYLLSLFSATEKDLLALHVRTVSDVLDMLRILKQQHPDLSMMIEKTRRGLLNRYRSSRFCLEMPQISTESALERGKQTIFTDFHGAFLMVAGAAVDPEIRQRVIAQFDVLEEIIDHSSYIHRILNDVGKAGIQPHKAAQIFSLTADVKGIFPRDLVENLTRSLSQDDQRYFARLIKDVKENEANIILDSCHESYLPLAEALIQDLMLLNRQLTKSLTILEELVPQVRHNYLASLIPDLIEFEQRMYSRLVSEGGEYVETNEEFLFNALDDILGVEQPVVFIHNLIAQKESDLR